VAANKLEGAESFAVRRGRRLRCELQKVAMHCSMRFTLNLPSIGYAAGCEAGLCPAVSSDVEVGCAPGPGPALDSKGQSPNRGQSPNSSL
jgi:hypothetical protein